MPTPVQPLRLLVLAHEPEWLVLLRSCLTQEQNQANPLFFSHWNDINAALVDDHHTVLLTTPELQPPPGRCNLPVVMLLEEEPLIAPLGASDWLIRSEMTPAALRNCLRHVGERALLENTLQRLAEQDTLTGIANRQGFQTLLAARLLDNDGRGLALGHLDLDNFRRANDALGHQAGDRLILQVVARLKGQMEVGDQIARLGSDEFALLIDT
ncbi:GGDEF domain-containing protein, partial [Pseudomonas quasicaspiana]|nr:GGDEF domain-containing protein [Pseudomonas quasicaspiana]